MKSDTAYLEHILEAITTIDAYLKDVSYEEFENNKMIIDAVIRELEIVGEASNNLSDKFIKDNPEFPARDAIDMRNFLTHEYFGVNTKIVWETCKNDLPGIKEFIQDFLYNKTA